MKVKICPSSFLQTIKRLVSRRSGFTLVEMLISISIMGLIFGVGLARYRDFDRRQIVRQAAQELKTNLRLVQKKAISGEKDCSINASGGCGGDFEGCGENFATPDPDERTLINWTVVFSLNNYRFFGMCCINPITPSGCMIFSISDFYYLPTGVTVQLPYPSFRFRALTGKVDNETSITLVSSSGNQKLTVGQGGGIIID
ncbi:Tfp pilus assembly protein FimT/FimU [Patescibacteria group bacterium]